MKWFLVSIALLIGVDPALAHAGSTTSRTRANRLAGEASPYLRLHALNPVDWYPWGEEAFAKARAQNKPIFLSIGYSTCHWCHVMARESFENEEVAWLLNTNVVSIKVDRERHPEIDATYMLATELISGRGGWPNSVFLTPDLKPFFAATYLPPDHLKRVLTTIGATWGENAQSLRADSEKVATLIERIMSQRVAAASLTPDVLGATAAKLLEQFDPFHGGLGTAPKFPREPVLVFLLHRAERDRDAKALAAARITLDNILMGGIHDQLGGGFHRYAVDNAWRVPHFEKMLYNQALISQALVRAYRITAEQRYAQAARGAFDFVLSSMTDAEGGFYSALDAETDGWEGLYYLWTRPEIEAALGADAAFAIAALGVTEEGNLEGRNVLHLPEPPEALAKAAELTLPAFDARAKSVTTKLLAVRSARKAPKRDDKILAAWNGLMVEALAEGSRALGEPRYLEAAERAATFLLERMGGAASRLKRAFFEGKADLEGTHADYVFTSLGLIALFDATREPRWLDAATRLAETMIERFLDTEAGDFHMSVGIESFVRTKQRGDAEIPSSNAAALDLLARLARRTQSPDWRHRAEALSSALSGLALAAPLSNSRALRAADVLLRGETGPLQYLAKGTVRAEAVRDEARGLLRVRLEIAPGWHINAYKPLEDFLNPTVVSLEDVPSAAVAYPAPVNRRLAFNTNELALYEGTLEITLPLPPDGQLPAVATLGLQACSDRICLEPETAHLLVPAPPS